jgi:hypothetical protein
LTPAVARVCRIKRLTDYWKILAVQDAYKLLPYADALYGCCPSWWRVHRDCCGFANPKWTTHEGGKDSSNQKLAPDAELKAPLADLFGLQCVRGEHGDQFSLDPEVIRYGSNSGFQAINLAILLGCKRIVLVGFDMRCPSGEAHFFGNHPKPLHQNKDEDYRRFIPHFARAAKALPADVEIVNATPASALSCFPMMPLDDALSDAHGYAAAV